ncbi:unnamed protein product [Clonostachys byssicola]|uniref:Enoyl reductase (ER) domain-containing protein n=1 Tax=Clonostachys byssicola TaxID=160290 RepID=A0A9N9U893_9HYPO|nr:unnamed protein product [Clonostachys byssicola]
MASVPKTMRSLVAPKKGPPSTFEIASMPTPSIKEPTDVLIHVRAASLGTGDVQIAGGKLEIFYKATFPLKIGNSGAGVVAAVGDGVKHLKVGDEVYGTNISKPMFRIPPPGFVSEYTVCPENLLIRKPPSVSFEEAASFTPMVVAAYQVIKRGLQVRGEESLEGKTVFVPGALSGTGSIIIQVAKNFFGAAKIISTVSTAKVPLVEEYLPGMVDQVIDYKTQKVGDLVPQGTVDFAVNTQMSSMDDCIAALDKKTGTLMSITSIPTKSVAKEIMGADRFPWWFGVILDLAQYYYTWKFWGTNIYHEMVSGSPDNREDLEMSGEIVALGKVKAVMRVVQLEDIEAIRKNCEEVYAIKGGIGKLVVVISK